MKKLLTYTALATLSLSSISYGETCPDPDSFIITKERHIIAVGLPDLWYIHENIINDPDTSIHFVRSTWYSDQKTVWCEYAGDNQYSSAYITIHSKIETQEPRSNTWIKKNYPSGSRRRQCVSTNINTCYFIQD